MAVTFDLYVWSGPRDLDADGARGLIDAWHSAGADPATSPFEATTDVGWFHRELIKDVPDLDLVSDAVPNLSKTPIWLSADDEPPARMVAIRLTRDNARDVLESVTGLAAKYDLVVYDALNNRLHLPLEELAEYASATFWPAGAIRAAVVGGIGLVVAVVAWNLGIFLLSPIVALVGGFLFVMAVYTFVHEGREVLKGRG